VYGHQSHPDAPLSSEARSRIENGWRLSPTGSTAVRAAEPGSLAESRDFCATPGVLAAANTALSQSGATVRLESAGPAPDRLGERGLVKVSPVIVHELPQQPRIELRGDQLLTVTECNVVAQMLLNVTNWQVVFRGADSWAVTRQGLHDVLQDFAVYPRLLPLPDLSPDGLADRLQHVNDDIVRFEWAKPDGGRVLIRATYDENIGGQTATQQAGPELVSAGVSRPYVLKLMAFIKERLLNQPTYQQLLVDRLVQTQALDQPADQLPQLAAAALQYVKQELGQPYPPYDSADAELRAGIAARLGVNQGAEPAVGEAFATASTRDWTLGETQAAAPLRALYPELLPWSYHVAAVVAQDGGARITLENYNRRGAPGGEGHWYFAMYGPEPERTFHTLLAPQTGAGVTLVLRPER
jgi:hypothetical protein